ncbi:hypothetical protein [Aquihabitans sp. McL0605]|uniref:hypothetical protein n=1 Tax=Aquihabitans sp. McL0605 TaxID=3415671 RepID=UPI003CEE9849
MDMTRYVEELKQQLVATADLGGDDTRALAERLVPHLEGMVRLVLLDALSAAADEITTELAPGSVSVRLRGRDPEFEVVPPPAAMTSPDITAPAATAPPPSTARPEPTGDDDGEISRITLRLPEQLKTQVEQAAAADRLSVNAWLVRAVADALGSGRPDPRPTATTPLGGQRLSGWAR